jgi:hypothetical protein
MGNGVPSELRCEEQLQEVDQVQSSGKAALLLSRHLCCNCVHHHDKDVPERRKPSPSDSIADPVEDNEGCDHYQDDVFPDILADSFLILKGELFSLALSGGFGALFGQSLERLDHCVHIVADEDAKEEIEGDHYAGEVVLLDDVIMDQEFGNKVEEGEEEDGEEYQRLEGIGFGRILVVHLKDHVIDDHYESDSGNKSAALSVHLVKEFGIWEDRIQCHSANCADVGEEGENQEGDYEGKNELFIPNTQTGFCDLVIMDSPSDHYGNHT